VTKTPQWPINGSDLVRLLGLPHDRYHVLTVVRPLLDDLGCPKTGSSIRSNWVVDRDMARQVEEVLRGRGFAVRPIP
jgi:hypothetical protein